MKVLLTVLVVLILTPAAIFGGLALYRRFFGPPLKPPVDGDGMTADWRSRVCGEWITADRGHEHIYLVIDSSDTIKIFEHDKPVYDGPYTCDAEKLRLCPISDANAVEGGYLPYEVFLFDDSTKAGDTLVGWICDPDRGDAKNARAQFIRKQ